MAKKTKKTTPPVNEEELIYHFQLPDANLMWQLSAPLRAYFSPTYFGLDNLHPDKPALYIGNHTLYGGLDVPLYITELYCKRGIFLRSLGDKMHYKVPTWREFVTKYGAVVGSRENCDKLMEARQHLLVFPGGTREICKRKGEEYQLTWKNRLGFARMAIQNGYPIIPLASLGPDEAYTIVYDAADMLNSPLGKWLKRTRLLPLLRQGEALPPLSRGLGFTGLPRPEKFYFEFGQPIDTTRFAGQHENEDVLWALRHEVETAVYAQLNHLREYRKENPDTELWRKLLKKL